MANFCSECGSTLSQDARFCAECGTPVQGTAKDAVGGTNDAAPVVPVVPVVHDSQVTDDADRAPVSRKVPMLLTGAALLAIAIGGGAWLGLSSTGTTDEAGLEAASEPQEAATERLSFFAVAEANLRDAPTLDGSKVVGSLKRGEKATGTLVLDNRGKQWLKIDGSGRFISIANLSKSQPPVLASQDGSDRITTGSCSVLETAAAEAAVKVALKPGAAVRLVGATADGFTEFALPGGGVGYVGPSDACATDPSPAKGAVANSLIQFDVRTCELGPELQPYFDKARERRLAEGNEEDGEEYSFPVDKRFRGLRVTSVIVGYEWTGVAFGDPASKVQAAFRQMGFKIDKNGDFTVPDDVPVVTSLRATDPSARSRGQSELICGV